LNSLKIYKEEYTLDQIVNNTRLFLGKVFKTDLSFYKYRSPKCLNNITHVYIGINHDVFFLSKGSIINKSSVITHIDSISTICKLERGKSLSLDII
jgi:hypothetical protein